MRMLICGGRGHSDYDFVARELDDIVADFGQPDVVMHGDARGADRLGAQWAKARGVRAILPFPADWDRYGPAAGPIRNAQMIDEGRPDFGVAFPGGAGTADMVRRLRAAGVMTIEIPSEGRK